MKKFKKVFLIVVSWFQICLGFAQSIRTPSLGADSDFLPADMLSSVSAGSQPGSPGKSSSITSNVDNASFSTSSSTSSGTLDLYSSKKKFLTLVRSYLKFDKHEPDLNLNVQMKQLQKKSLVQLMVQFEHDPGFEKRYRFLQHVKTFLMRYQNLPEDRANAQINLLQDLSIDQMHQKYYGWCQKLTKNQMLEMIHEHEQFDRGFFGLDADQEIATLSKEPLPSIRDRFMQYQRTFVTKDLDKLPDQSRLDRQKLLQQQFDQQKSSRKFVRKIPLIKNVEELLPSRITNWTDQQLFERISIKMHDLGFPQVDIDQEIEKLKQSSIADLQENYPHLQEQLANQLHYFDTAKHQSSDTVKSADFWLKQLHAWGTTAAMIAAAGAAAAGYDSSLLDAVAGFALFDPRLTLASGMTKRDLLDMIYAQYSAFDSLQHVYLDHEYQEVQLWTKPELLQKISDCLRDLNVSSNVRQQQEVKYQNFSKQELQDLYEELNFFAYDEYKPSLSLLEENTLLQTKSELLDSIKNALGRLGIPQDEIDQKTQLLNNESVQFLRAARIDAQDAIATHPIKFGVMPTFTTTKEELIRKAPKTLGFKALGVVSDSMADGLRFAGKRPAYIHWKTSSTRDYVARKPDGTFDRVSTALIQGQRAFSLINMNHQQALNLQHHHALEQVSHIVKQVVEQK